MKNIYPALVCSGAANKSQITSAADALFELVQTLLALSNQSAMAEAWVRRGMPMLHLDHHMFYYAMPGLAESARDRLWALTQEVEPISADQNNRESLTAHLSEQGIRIFISDLTPACLKGELFCARALSPDLNPLVVGNDRGPVLLTRNPQRFSGPHPFP